MLLPEEIDRIEKMNQANASREEIAQAISDLRSEKIQLQQTNLLIDQWYLKMMNLMNVKHNTIFYNVLNVS